MQIRKRIISFVLALLMLSSVCYVDAPTAKAVNETAQIESFLTWYTNSYRGSTTALEQELVSVNQLMSANLMTDLNEIMAGAAQGNYADYDEITSAVENIIEIEKDRQSGEFTTTLPTGDWNVLKRIMVKSVTVYDNGGSIPGLVEVDTPTTGRDTLAKQQEMANVMTEAKRILNEYIYKGTLGSGDQLDAAAWVVCQEINALKAKGFSDLAIIGAMCNMKSESGFDPYMIQDGMAYAFNEFVMTSSDIMLKLNGEDPFAKYSDKTKIEAELQSAGRVNFTVSQAPTKGIGLFQFTDCSTNMPRYYDLMSGYRRSCAINEFLKCTEDPWTCILECGSYNYWISPENVDNSKTDTIVQEDGSTTTFTYNEDYESTTCTKSENLNTIAIAGPDIQIGFFAELDGPRCWLFSDFGKGYFQLYGKPEYADFTFNDYKTFQGSGNPATDAKDATLLFLLGVERPGKTSKGYDAITDVLNVRFNPNVVTAISKIGGFNGYTGLNLEAIAYNSSFNSNGLSYESMLNGTADYTHLKSLAQSGYYTSSELSQACSSFEDNVESELLTLADRSYMTRKELYNLVAWEEQVNTTSLENNLIMLGRQITLWTGIMLLVWSVLFYLAYWLDRLNTMFYLDFVGILTFKRLQASDAPENSTYNLTKEELGNKKVRIVVHRDVIKICILSITVGTIFATGSIFNILRGLFMWFWNFLS